MTNKSAFKTKLNSVRSKIKENPANYSGLKDQIEFSPMNWKKTGPFNRGGSPISLSHKVVN